MAPQSQHAVTTVFSTHVKSHDEKSILIEAGGFTPARWFMERGSQPESHDAEPPEKKRKTRHNTEIGRDLTASSDWTQAIPLFDVTVDFHFPDTATGTPPSTEAIANDVHFEQADQLAVIPHSFEVDDGGTRLRFSSSKAKSPLLVLECDSISNDTAALLQIILSSDHPKRLASAHFTWEGAPASLISCTLTRSVGPLYTIIRLQASLRWRDGASAFPSGAPSGRYRIYPDYGLLLQAYADHAREACDHSQPWTPQDFYESLHVPSKDIDVHGQFENVLESELYPFQKRAVAWMLAREGITSLANGTRTSSTQYPMCDFYAPVKDVDGQECFVNHLQGTISRTRPEDGAGQLSGGLLLEEMGLGKTVELVALVSLHPRPTNVPSEQSSAISPELSPTRSRATLIITPASILQQWQSEFHRHAPNLSVYHYEGIPTGLKKAPSEDKIIAALATKYDVVLATYNTLARELHFATEAPEREMRHARKYERKRSPLIQIEWWRICLDEAQMVESGVTAAARVACCLPRVHSWAVSGTPLRKNIEDLHGLLIFLGYEPFSTEQRLWGHLVTNHRHLFRRIFGSIALRHTKALVRDELHLPPQKRVVVTVPFSVVEQQNYSTLFQQMCEDLGLDADGSPIIEDWDPEIGATIEGMRSWLVRLRQTCLHPQVGGRNRRALGRGVGPLRTVSEVLEVMIEQNETNMRIEERNVVTCSMTRAHILGNNGEDEHRSENALTIYTESMHTSEKMVRDARRDLAAAKAVQMAKGETAAETDEEDSSSESTPVLGRLRNSLRTALQLYHVCTFFAATSYFQIKTNKALTLEDSERFKELESKESDLYDIAKALRKEILKDTSRKAEVLIRQIKDRERDGTLTKISEIEDLQSLGGIESRRLTEKADDLFDVIRSQTEVIKEWRAKMAEFLVKPLVDEENEGIETTGDEYEDSTKQQDELYAYFDAFKAIHADLGTFVTGESAPLIDHEVKGLVRDAKRFLDPDTPEVLKPTDVHAPELTLKLFAIRNRFRNRKDAVGSIRSLIQDARSLEVPLQVHDGSIRGAEQHIIKSHLAALQSLFSAYTKILAGLEKEVDLFRTTQNQRVEFYRQLQELSDAVAPYKDEHDAQLDQHALNIAMHKEEQAMHSLAQLRTKNRFLIHLRDESGAQAGPKICIICTTPFERGVLTVCGHQFCKDCIQHWFQQSKSCPVCKRRLSSHDLHDITFKPQELRAQEEVHSGESSSLQPSNSTSPSSRYSLFTDVESGIMDEIKAIDLPSSYGTKIDTLARHLHWIREHDAGAKSIVFSQYREFLDVLGGALKEFKVGFSRLGRPGAAERFRNDPSVDCILLDAKTDSSGLTLVNATHVFICEPLIQTAVELQAIARVHRIGQTRPTTVWMYLINETVEEAIYEISVARRLAHVQSRQQHQQQRQSSSSSLTQQPENSKSRASTPAPLLENAIDAANSEELQSAPLSKLLVAGKGGGELVGKDDLWQCLFGKAQQQKSNALSAVTVLLREQEVSRHLRAEAAEARAADRKS